VTQAIDADDNVTRFRAEVLPRLAEKYRPTKVLVFGSRARGDAFCHSDLDVLVVSPAFAGIEWWDRALRVYEECEIHLDVELLCYTPHEYAAKVDELGIVRTATLEGVDLLGGPRARVAEPRPPRPERVRAWLAQAQRDLEQAEVARQVGHHDWACFAAQQAAEKGLKGLLLRCGREGRGHVLVRLLERLPSDIPVSADLIEQARVLDACYLPARYPNTHDEGAPFEHFGPRQSEQGIACAREIVEFCCARVG
jgi:HEPN domain-containing protein/predicted nucleotidyltransferase